MKTEPRGKKTKGNEGKVYLAGYLKDANLSDYMKEKLNLHPVTREDECINLHG